MSDNLESRPPSPAPRRRGHRRGVVTGAILTSLIVFALIFGLLYMLLAGVIGFGLAVAVAAVPAVLVGCGMSIWDATADIAAAIGELILAVLAGIGAVFAALFSIFS